MPDIILNKESKLTDEEFTIVDTFDAMTSNRSYRKALSFRTALSEIERNKGLQFDPDITDIFLYKLQETPYFPG